MQIVQFLVGRFETQLRLVDFLLLDDVLDQLIELNNRSSYGVGELDQQVRHAP